MSDERDKLMNDEHEKFRAAIIAPSVLEPEDFQAALLATTLPDEKPIVPPRSAPEVNALAAAAAATSEALAREQEQRLQIEAEYAQRVADEQRLHLGLQLIEDGEHEDAVARIASDLHGSSPQLAEVLTQRWEEYDPDSAWQWAEQHAANAARAAEYAPTLAAIGESARRAKIEQEAQQAVQTYTKTVGAEIKSRYSDAEQVLAKADPQTVADVLKALEENKVPGREDPRVQAEATYRWVKAHETRAFADAVLNAGNAPSAYREPVASSAPVTVDMRGLQEAAYTTPDIADEVARATVVSKTAVQDAMRTLHEEATEHFDAERRKNDPRPVPKLAPATEWKPPKPRSQAELEAYY